MSELSEIEYIEQLLEDLELSSDAKISTLLTALEADQEADTDGKASLGGAAAMASLEIKMRWKCPEGISQGILKGIQRKTKGDS